MYQEELYEWLENLVKLAIRLILVGLLFIFSAIIAGYVYGELTTTKEVKTECGSCRALKGNTK